MPGLTKVEKERRAEIAAEEARRAAEDARISAERIKTAKKRGTPTVAAGTTGTYRRGKRR